jgi:hypothetical protein
MADFVPMEDFTPEEVPTVDEAETSLIDDTSLPDAEVWEASNDESATWAAEGVPAGLPQSDVADFETTADLVKRWRAELGTSAEDETDLHFISSKKGDL